MRESCLVYCYSGIQSLFEVVLLYTFYTGGISDSDNRNYVCIRSLLKVGLVPDSQFKRADTLRRLGLGQNNSMNLKNERATVFLTTKTAFFLPVCSQEEVLNLSTPATFPLCFSLSKNCHSNVLIWRAFTVFSPPFCKQLC